MLTLAFSMILYSLLLRLYWLTGGTDGMVTAPPTILGVAPGAAAGRAHYYLTLVCLALALALTRRWLGSPLGYLASAIRDNEIRVDYIGASVRQRLYRTDAPMYSTRISRSEEHTSDSPHTCTS